MTDTDTAPEVWLDRPLTDAQQRNRQAADLIPFGDHGVTPQTFAQAVDFAKVMSTARGAVPAHLINNAGACLAVIELGQKFQMSAYMLAMGCYSVNNMLAFTGQTIMAIMNKHMPLAKDEKGNRTRLRYEFQGEHAAWKMEEVAETDRNDEPTGKKIWVNKLVTQSTRRVIVRGRMEGEAEDLVYESPPVSRINNKKSPLWQEDEDQQLIYWASRRWQRRWWPEGMLGIYDRDEVSEMHIGADNAKLINAEDRGKALLERLENNKVGQTDAAPIREGFDPDHAQKETTIITTDTEKGVTATVTAHVEGDKVVVDETKIETESPKLEEPKPEEPKAATKKKTAAKDKVAPEPEIEHEVLPKNVAEYQVWFKDWLAKTPPKELDKRWRSEIKLRNACGVIEDVRDKMFDALLAKRDA